MPKSTPSNLVRHAVFFRPSEVIIYYHCRCCWVAGALLGPGGGGGGGHGHLLLLLLV